MLRLCISHLLSESLLARQNRTRRRRGRRSSRGRRRNGGDRGGRLGWLRQRGLLTSHTRRRGRLLLLLLLLHLLHSNSVGLSSRLSVAFPASSSLAWKSAAGAAFAAEHRGRVLATLWLVRFRESRHWYIVRQVLAAALVMGSFLGAPAADSLAVRLVYIVACCLLLPLYIAAYLTQFDRALMRELLVTWEWLYLVATAVVTSAAYLWCIPDLRVLWSSALSDTLLLCGVTILSVSLDAAPTFRTSTKALMIVVLLAHSIRVVVSDKITPYFKRYLCLNAHQVTAENLAENPSYDAWRYADCLDSRSILLGGHSTLLLFFSKYLCIVFWRRWTRQPPRALLLHQALRVEQRHADDQSDNTVTAHVIPFAATAACCVEDSKAMASPRLSVSVAEACLEAPPLSVPASALAAVPVRLLSSVSSPTASSGPEDPGSKAAATGDLELPPHTGTPTDSAIAVTPLASACVSTPRAQPKRRRLQPLLPRRIRDTPQSAAAAGQAETTAASVQLPGTVPGADGAVDKEAQPSDTVAGDVGQPPAVADHAETAPLPTAAAEASRCVSPSSSLPLVGLPSSSPTSSSCAFVRVSLEPRPGFCDPLSVHHLVAVQFRGEMGSDQYEYAMHPLLSNAAMQRATHTRSYMAVVTLLAVVMGVNVGVPSLLSTMDGAMAWSIVAAVLLLCCPVIVCQLTVMDRRLSLRLLRSFDFFYLICTLLVHLWAAVLDRSPVASASQVTLTMFGFCITVAFLLVMDAQPTASGRIKLLVAGLHTANSLRWILQTLLMGNPRPAAQIDFVYPVNARALALSTFSVMGLFFTRYFVQLLRHPRRLIILKATVCMINNQQRGQETETGNEQSRRQPLRTQSQPPDAASHYVIQAASMSADLEGEQSTPTGTQATSALL